MSGLLFLVPSMLLLDPTFGAALASLPLLLGLTWRSDELPIVPFCLGYQWVFVVSGYSYQLFYGFYPSRELPGNMSGALLLSALGLLLIGVGVRTSYRFLPRSRSAEEEPNYDIRRLFWWVLLLFSAFLFFRILPKQIFYGASQAIEAVLHLRYLPLFLLFHAILRERRGYAYGALGAGCAMAPEIASGMSGFKEVLFLVLLALLHQWRPWLADHAQRKRNRRLLLWGTALVTGLVGMGLLWNGELKSRWRNLLWEEGVSGRPVQQTLRFGQLVLDTSDEFSLQKGIEKFAQRLSSGALYFSLVINRVPEKIPYEDGALMERALMHIFKPRIFFPDKESLGSDSWLVRRYAGVRAAGEERGTSVGLGYLAEFYLDFGVLGVCLFAPAYGFLVGGCLWIMRRVSPATPVYSALAAAILLQNFVSYEGTFPKLLGGLLQMTLITCLAIYHLGPALHKRWLRVRPSRRLG